MVGGVHLHLNRVSHLEKSYPICPDVAEKTFSHEVTSLKTTLDGRNTKESKAIGILARVFCANLWPTWTVLLFSQNKSALLRANKSLINSVKIQNICIGFHIQQLLALILLWWMQHKFLVVVIDDLKTTFSLLFSQCRKCLLPLKIQLFNEKIIFQKLGISFNDYDTINILHVHTCMHLLFVCFLHNIILQKILFNNLLDQTS